MKKNSSKIAVQFTTPVNVAINDALTPVANLVWGYEKMSKWLEHELNQRLKLVLPENIVSPKPSIVGPALEALRFLEAEQELKSLLHN